MKKNTFLIGAKVIYTNAGIFDWEDIDEAAHAGCILGKEYTVCESDDEGVKLEETDADVWISHFHFKNKTKLINK